MAITVRRLCAGDDTAAATALLIRFFVEEGFDTPAYVIRRRTVEMAAIDACGKELAIHFPRNDAATGHELPDRIYVI